jgi:hypothetical protein
MELMATLEDVFLNAPLKKMMSTQVRMDLSVLQLRIVLMAHMLIQFCVDVLSFVLSNLAPSLMMRQGNAYHSVILHFLLII